MTSSGAQECFVYITLPGAVSAVTAGRFVIDADSRGDQLGRFVYGRSYLENPEAVDIDPVELKLAEVTYETIRMNGVFGALRDAGPDFWGRRIIEKRAGIPKLQEIDYLLESPDDRAGALGFGLNRVPPAPLRKFNQAIDLESSKKSPRPWSGMRFSAIRSPSRFRTCYSSERRWAERARRPSSRMAMHSGSQNSRGPMIVGTIRGSSTRCWNLRGNAASMQLKAESQRWPAEMFS